MSERGAIIVTMSSRMMPQNDENRGRPGTYLLKWQCFK